MSQLGVYRGITVHPRDPETLHQAVLTRRLSLPVLFGQSSQHNFSEEAGLSFACPSASTVLRHSLTIGFL